MRPIDKEGKYHGHDGDDDGGKDEDDAGDDFVLTMMKVLVMACVMLMIVAMALMPALFTNIASIPSLYCYQYHYHCRSPMPTSVETRD